MRSNAKVKRRQATKAHEEAGKLAQIPSLRLLKGVIWSLKLLKKKKKKKHSGILLASYEILPIHLNWVLTSKRK